LSGENFIGGPVRYFLILLILLTLSVNAQTTLETKDFNVIDQHVQKKIKKYGANHVLIVLDIDNTVLKMNTNFGSDQWWGWQSSILGSKNCKFCVASSFSELLEIQGEIFAMARMSPTQKTAPKFVEKWQNQNVSLILLTSRGPNFRNATLNELKRNGYNPAKKAIGPKGGYASTYTPYFLSKLKSYGLTMSDAKISSLKPARKVSYQDGVYMTSGLNKGIMLKTLLHKTKSKFKAILFADDHEKHTKRMQEIMGTMKDVDVTTFRYAKIDPEVQEFKKSDKNKVHQTWLEFKKLRNLLK
jgi:hypothetical protein